MNKDIKEVLLTEEVLTEKIKEIGAEISKEYAGRDLIVLGILKGSVMFMSDLMKNITIPCKMDFMAVSSYGDATQSSGIVKIIKDLDFEIKGKYLMKYLGARNPRSHEIACLLNKPERRKEELDVKYLGFDVPDYFLVGYGLDYAEIYRNLPYIGILDEHVYMK